MGTLHRGCTAGFGRTLGVMGALILVPIGCIILSATGCADSTHEGAERRGEAATEARETTNAASLMDPGTVMAQMAADRADAELQWNGQVVLVVGSAGQVERLSDAYWFRVDVDGTGAVDCFFPMSVAPVVFGLRREALVTVRGRAQLHVGEETGTAYITMHDCELLEAGPRAFRRGRRPP